MSKMRLENGTRRLQNLSKLTRPAWSSVQHSENTGPSHTTRHASRLAHLLSCIAA